MESIIFSCLESKSDTMVDHLLRECDLMGKVLQTDKSPLLSGESDKVDCCHKLVKYFLHDCQTAVT